MPFDGLDDTVALSEDVHNNILKALAHEVEDICVEAPAGAGKTHTIEDCAALATLHLGRSVLVACPTNFQANDITRRLVGNFPALTVDRFVAGIYRAPRDLIEHPRVSIKSSSADLTAPITVATVAKLSEIHDLGFVADELLLDEAYQVRNADFKLIRPLGCRSTLIGDPGQIPPIVKTSIRFWAADMAGPHVPALQGLIVKNQARWFQMPISHRLPQDTVSFVQPAFYPSLPFHGMASEETRRIWSRAPGTTREDEILDVAISRGSIAMVTLPAVNTLPVDRELINLVVGMIRRLLARGFSYQDDGETGSLSPEDIGVVVSRRAQVGALTQALSSIGNIYVETANRFQGLQRRVVFTLHPLSGKRRPDEFSIHSGRMCVATTRHRICCVIVGREGIGESLGRYVPDDDRFLGQQNDPAFLGWKAHELLLSELERTDRIVKAA